MAFRNLKKLTVRDAHYSHDLSWLTRLSVVELTCSDDIAHKNAATLKAMNSLKRINGQAAADYWNKQ